MTGAHPYLTNQKVEVGLGQALEDHYSPRQVSSREGAFHGFDSRESRIVQMAHRDTHYRYPGSDRKHPGHLYPWDAIMTIL